MSKQKDISKSFAAMSLPVVKFSSNQTEDGEIRVEVRLRDATVWLSQKQLTELYQTSVSNINMHTKIIFDEGELRPD